MKSLRKKTTITKNQQFLYPFAILLLDLIIEILIKLPVKSIAKLIFVSKHWSSIIRNKDFTKLYITRSSSRPQFLFRCKNMQSQFLESCSQNEPSSNHQRIKITCPRDDYRHMGDYRHMNDFSAPVRGLICLRNGTKVSIGNPSTCQFLTLPRVKTRRRGLLCFFGYDPVNDVYKVLCMTVLHVYRSRGSIVVSEEHQIFTLGPKQKWRKIVCKHPHLPSSYPPTRTKGICINGVVYYYSWIKDEGSLICFNLTSEGNMMYDGRLDLWVLKDAKKQEWTKVSHLVPFWEYLVGTQKFSFEGTLSTGQLIFVPDFLIPINPYVLIIYDHKRNNAKKVVIEGIGNYSSYIGPMVLSNVS